MFINFGLRILPETNKHSLDSLVFPRGNLVFLPGLLFFLGSTEHYKAMKIGITCFGSKLDLLCISKVLPIFCVFSKIRLKRKAPGDTWRTRRVPGVGALGLAHSESSREGVLGARPTRRAPGRGSRGSATRDTWRAREHPGKLPARVSSGHASHSQGSRMWFTG